MALNGFKSHPPPSYDIFSHLNNNSTCCNCTRKLKTIIPGQMITDKKLYRGVDWFWLDTFNKYSAATYNCVLSFIQNGQNVLDLEATANGTDFQFELLFKDNTLNTGVYSYQYTFTHKTSYVQSTPYSGEIIIYTGSHDEQMLAALYAAQLRLVGRDYVQMSVNGRSVTFKNDADIARQITFYERKIGINRAPRILSRFV